MRIINQRKRKQKALHTFMIGSVILLLAACQNGNEEATNSEQEQLVSTAPIQVEFRTEAEGQAEGQYANGKEIKLLVEVTQDGQPVKDAKEVIFEIWQDSEENEVHHHSNQDTQEEQSKHENIPAKHQGKGIYSIDVTFDQVGTYSVMYHVTARDMHTMKTKEIVIFE